MALSYEEVKARLEEIIKEMEQPDADLDALEAEARSLKAQKEQLEQRAERRRQLTDMIARGAGVQIEKPGSEESFGIDSQEYRRAWLKTRMGAALTDTEKRAYATTDSYTAIPTLVAEKMFEKMKKLAPMLSEITLLQVAGNLKFVAEGTRNAATKHTQNSAETPAADTIVSVTLGAFEFFKLISISKSALAMSVDAFEGWLIDMLAGDIARAIDNYIINDSTNGIVAITYTTGTNRIVQTNGYGYGDIVDLIALLPAAYDPEAKFLVNKKTLYGEIAQIVNSSGDPIFVPDTVNGLGGRLMGYPVLVDDYVSTANKALYLGKWTDIVGNLSEDIHVDSDESAGFTANAIMYRGVAVFDSQPAKTDAFVRLVSTV